MEKVIPREMRSMFNRTSHHNQLVLDITLHTGSSLKKPTGFFFKLDPPGTVNVLTPVLKLRRRRSVNTLHLLFKL
ncbi:MAG: hypothetical protein IIB05_02670 [Bacteroidetes bacterium]|nr:hypothetical protein [Bacteroidota bacterium]